MKILISGGNGQLAYDCKNILSKKYEVISLSSMKMNIANPEEVERNLTDFMPDIVLNCAAYTKVDACETEKELAKKVNVDGPRNLAQVVEKLKSALVHISTDYVFNGQKNPPQGYVETDKPDPISYYGKTKLEGELEIQRATNRYAIIRTAWLYSIHGHNFLKTMLKLSLNNPQKDIKRRGAATKRSCRSGELTKKTCSKNKLLQSNSIRVVNDQFGSITWSYRLALQIEKIIDAKGRGIYHATAEGYSSWFEAAKYFLKKINIPHRLIPCSTEEYPTPACRPKNSILGNRRLKKEGINVMVHWKNDIDLFVSKFHDRLIKEATEAR